MKPIIEVLAKIPSSVVRNPVVGSIKNLSEALKIKVESKIPFAKDVKVSEYEIAKIGDFLCTYNIHYCLAPVIYPQDGEGFYAFYHFEGHKFPELEAQNFCKMISELREMNNDKKMSASVYRSGHFDVWEESGSKRLSNALKIERTLEENSIKYSSNVGFCSHIFTNGNVNKKSQAPDIYELNLANILSHLDHFKSSKSNDKDGSSDLSR